MRPWASGCGVAVVLCRLAIAFATEAGSEVDLSVRLVDHSGQSAADRDAALGVAAELMLTAGVRVVWKICPAEPSGVAACDAFQPQGERVVRIIPGPATRATSSSDPLGTAVIDSQSRTGTLATGYWDRITRTATRAGVSSTTLLGRVIAHELGHLLLGTNKHAASGLMRSVWTPAEMRLSRPADWQFSPQDAAAIRFQSRRQ